MNAEACTLETPLASFLVRHRVRFMQISVITVASLLLVREYRPGELSAYDQARIGGIALILAGLSMRSWAAAVLQKCHSLATSGPYSMCRHPLYVGSTLMLVGFCVLIGDVLTAAVLLSTWCITYPATVAREEALLMRLFPADWGPYAAATPRVFPPRLPEGLGNISLARWVQNREYQAVVASFIGMAAVEVWRRIG